MIDQLFPENFEEMIEKTGTKSSKYTIMPAEMKKLNSIPMRYVTKRMSEYLNLIISKKFQQRIDTLWNLKDRKKAKIAESMFKNCISRLSKTIEENMEDELKEFETEKLTPEDIKLGRV